MKQKSTSRMENIKAKLKTIGLCMTLAIGGASMATAQHVSQPVQDAFDTEKGQNNYNERSPGNTPIRNIVITPICPSINSIYMVDMGFDKALIQWDNMMNFDSISFRYTQQGTTNTNTISIPGSPNPGRYFIQGLTSHTIYDIEVRTVCANGSISPWTAPITVTTLSPRLANNQRNTNMLNMNPNPATTLTTISFVATTNTPQQVVISSSTGQIVYKNQVLPTADKVQLTVDVSAFPIGIYFVKVSNSNGVSVERLIVQ